MTMVGEKWTTRLPSDRTRLVEHRAVGVGARARRSTTRVISKMALKSGSSKHGKARRASVDSICVVAMTRSTPDWSMNVER